MGIVSRDPGDRRTVGQIVDDVSHDLYHKVTSKVDRSSPDAGKRWPHEDDCEWKRSNDR